MDASSRSSQPSLVAFVVPALFMAAIIWISNHLVQFGLPFTLAGIDLANWLTWAAFTFPVAFLITDTTNRLLGPANARRVVYVGFATGVVLSVLAGDPRIGIASGTAFLTAQLLDVFVFDRLRNSAWWKAPVLSSFLASALDTALFFGIAFAGTDVPWVQLALGDFAVKLLMIAALLYPFKLIVSFYPTRLQNA